MIDRSLRKVETMAIVGLCAMHGRIFLLGMGCMRNMSGTDGPLAEAFEVISSSMLLWVTSDYDTLRSHASR